MYIYIHVYIYTCVYIYTVYDFMNIWDGSIFAGEQNRRMQIKRCLGHSPIPMTKT